MRLAMVLLALCVSCGRASFSETTVPVGSLSLHIQCRGEGKPLVVLDAGLGNDARVWSAVQAEVARTTRVCAYDRAGLGASGPAPRPHSNVMMSEELVALLRAAKLPGPYVLVGHSMGGVNVRLLAEAHPEAVAGMVLVDSMSESQPTQYWALIPDVDMTRFRAGIGQLPEGTDFETLSHGLAEVARAGNLGGKPLVVLTRDVEDAPPGTPPETVARLRAAWQRIQLELSSLSSNSAHIVVTGAHHMIHVERPGVVAAAIREVVGAVREHRSVNDAVLLTAAP